MSSSRSVESVQCVHLMLPSSHSRQVVVPPAKLAQVQFAAAMVADESFLIGTACMQLLELSRDF